MDAEDDVDYTPTVFTYSKKRDDHAKAQIEERKKRLEKRRLSTIEKENQIPIDAHHQSFSHNDTGVEEQRTNVSFKTVVSWT